MTLRYRTAGAWGAGIGANLSPAQVDENFYTLKTLIDGFTAPVGVGIASIDVVGTQMTIHLTDSSTQGPFALPFATFVMTGDWTADTDYVPMDLFVIAGGSQPGLYLVALAYHSDTDFDPAVTDTDGNPLLTFVLPYAPGGGAAGPLTVVNDTSLSWDLARADNGKYIRLNGDVPDASTEDNGFAVNIPTVDTDHPFDVGFYTTFRQSGTIQIAFDWGTSTTVNWPASLGPYSREQGSTVTIVYVGEDTWDISGDLSA